MLKEAALCVIILSNSFNANAVDLVVHLVLPVHHAAVTTIDVMTTGTDVTVTSFGLGDNMYGAASAAPSQSFCFP